MESDLIARLAAAAEIAAIVAVNVDDDQRERPSISWFGHQRGDGYPSLVLSKISPGREWTHDGPDGLDGPRVQFDAYARDVDAAAELSRALRAVMEAGGDQDGTRFHPARVDTEQWFDEGEQGGGNPLFRVSQDFIFYHEQL